MDATELSFYFKSFGYSLNDELEELVLLSELEEEELPDEEEELEISPD